jgi:hypothetical protein
MIQTTASDAEGRAPAASEPAQMERQRLPVVRTVYLCDRVQYQAVQAVQYRLYETDEKLEDRGTKC